MFTRKDSSRLLMLYKETRDNTQRLVNLAVTQDKDISTQETQIRDAISDAEKLCRLAESKLFSACVIAGVKLPAPASRMPHP